MDNHPYLTFRLHNSFYGVNALIVQEIFYLPEIIPLAEAPDDIVGVINLRGQIVPIMDLHRRFGYRSTIREYHLSDSIIIFRWQDLQIGVIVSEVCAVQAIPADAITTQVSYGRDNIANRRFIQGVAKVDAEIIMLLNHDALISYSTQVHQHLEQESNHDPAAHNGHSANGHTAGNDLASVSTQSAYLDFFWPQATTAERQTLRQRAAHLMQRSEEQDLSGLLPLAVIGLNDEYFGLDLDLVREFTSVHQVTPIPCCPPHILGNINLRGEIVTLVDIRGLLNIPQTTHAEGISSQGSDRAQAMIVRHDDVVAGIAVDQVFDVTHLDPAAIMPVPAAVAADNHEYLRGTAAFRNKLMSILDFSKILTNGELVVSQEI